MQVLDYITLHAFHSLLLSLRISRISSSLETTKVTPSYMIHIYGFFGAFSGASISNGPLVKYF